MLEEKPNDVVYLFGAGATHACVNAVGSAYGILMGDLTEEILDRVRTTITTEPKFETLETLFNSVIDENTDFEHIITFLDQSTSAHHRQFAESLRDIFESVLKARLEKIRNEQGGLPTHLYEALLEFHGLDCCPERLKGILTLNYDNYLETAARKLNRTVNFGISIENNHLGKNPLEVIKLHGSFTWGDDWPVNLLDTGSHVWIPPGIQKAKDRYPYNLLWGKARELLDCDVVRIIGCRLGSNDWDLISLLFTTQHTNANRTPFEVEVIDSPQLAEAVKKSFPYLSVKSILECAYVGSRLIEEFSSHNSDNGASLEDDPIEEILKHIKPRQNWFRVWLQQLAEYMYTEHEDVGSDDGAFKKILEAHG